MSRTERRPVVIAAGGTGGHVVPALAVAARLKSRNIPVVWFGTRVGLEASMVPAQNIPMQMIDVSGLRGKGLLDTLLAPFKLVYAVSQSIRYLLQLKPRAVLGMGGFVSGPVGIAALMLRKPLVLHEQNAVAGMTNRWLSVMATRVFSAWPNVFKASSNAMVVGNPVRSDMETLAVTERVVRTDADKPLQILVVGGSRGAQALNQTVPQAAALIDRAMHIHHQTGSLDASAVRNAYQHAPLVMATVSEFIDDMTSAYGDADVVVCRSGAMTVTELSALAIPSILVPYPYAVDDHQTLNARHLSDAGAALLIPEQRLDAKALAQALLSLADNRQTLVQMSKAARSCFIPGAAATVAHSLAEVSR